ncbi:MAG: hypothetical protein ABW020_06400 [Candidatus Rokuibacteriota bacterium]
MREYHYRADTDGRIFHDGTEIVDPATLRFFVLAMQQVPDGRYLALCQGERNWFEPALGEGDTPLVVQRLRLAVADGRLAGVEVGLPGDHWEALDAGSLESVQDRLYCRVRRGALRARLGRVALSQLAPFLSDDEGAATLALGGARHVIVERAPVPI